MSTRPERQLKVAQIAGIQVKVDWSWLILAFFLVTLLSASFFPILIPEQTSLVYWSLGVAGAIGLFLSLLVHEFCHALVGRSQGLQMKEITLFLFGGAAQMDDEPPTAGAEFKMAIAGPLASVALAVIFFTLSQATEAAAGPAWLVAGFGYLATVNVILAAFNMLPGFPLDGGRVLRSALWAWKKDLVLATQWATGLGQLFGFALMVLGGVAAFSGNVLSGLWSFFLGLMLANIARASYIQLLVRENLRGRPAARFMDTHPATVSPNAPVSALVTETIQREELTVVPVVHVESFVGCVDLRRLREIPENEWNRHPVRELLQECSPELSIEPEADAEQALRKMARAKTSVLMVIKNNRLVGTLSHKGLLRYLTIRQHQAPLTT